jgi:hypothetical protein
VLASSITSVVLNGDAFLMASPSSTKKAFAEGSYEIVNSRVQPGGGEMLVETANRLLKELTYPAP